MTGRTHDLAAFTALSYILATQLIHPMSLGTAIVALSANLVGGLTPDIDQPTADLWRRLPAGSIFGKLLAPLLGGHRFLSHSIIGIVIFGWGFSFLLKLAGHTLIVNQQIVWSAFMIGFISHLIMDTFTREGVPWLFPIPFHFGIPPLKFLRIKTGGLIEKAIIFPGLLLVNGYLYYIHHHTILLFLKHLI